jgi:hypothetical protein
VGSGVKAGKGEQLATELGDLNAILGFHFRPASSRVCRKAKMLSDASSVKQAQVRISAHEAWLRARYTRAEFGQLIGLLSRIHSPQ